ncbi:unnamed protein product [Brassicogethes aeneus]|uniref:DUF659 domain-containing protein n=1 Tax=Brassicogethes aeneus TaxID=1431903 RepID=A0A9P0FEC1_BRAAE|nr:unnamed protein product [Brassicogethes aeneus]
MSEYSESTNRYTPPVNPEEYFMEKNITPPPHLMSLKQTQLPSSLSSPIASEPSPPSSPSLILLESSPLPSPIASEPSPPTSPSPMFKESGYLLEPNEGVVDLLESSPMPSSISEPSPPTSPSPMPLESSPLPLFRCLLEPNKGVVDLFDMNELPSPAKKRRCVNVCKREKTNNSYKNNLKTAAQKDLSLSSKKSVILLDDDDSQIQSDSGSSENVEDFLVYSPLNQSYNADGNENTIGCDSHAETPIESLIAEVLFDPKTGSMLTYNLNRENGNNKDLNGLAAEPVELTQDRPISAASKTNSYDSGRHGSHFSSSEARPHSSFSLASSSGRQSLTSTEESSKSLPSLSAPLSSKRNYNSKMVNKKISSFIDQLNPKDIEEANKALAKFFFGCNIPLSVVESDHFKNFIANIRPAYSSKLPSRKVLSTTLLDKTYNKCIEKSSKSLNVYSVLLIDGWKNSSSNTKTVVSMLHNAGGSQAFLNAWDLTGDSETGDKLSEIVNESIQMAKDLYNTRVYAVVSDNASAMLKMGRTVEIWHSNCNSHTAYLLAKDVLDADCTKNVIIVLKEFKQSDLERALVDNNGHRIKLPCDTRWCSYRDSYVSLIKNLHIMKNLIVNDPNFKKIKQNVKSLIFDDCFAEQVKEYILLFDPICTLINRTQSKNCGAAEAANLWMNLKTGT